MTDEEHVKTVTELVYALGDAIVDARKAGLTVSINQTDIDVVPLAVEIWRTTMLFSIREGERHAKWRMTDREILDAIMAGGGERDFPRDGHGLAEAEAYDARCAEFEAMQENGLVTIVRTLPSYTGMGRYSNVRIRITAKGRSSLEQHWAP
jgi:hypothetical protein